MNIRAVGLGVTNVNLRNADQTMQKSHSLWKEREGSHQAARGAVKHRPTGCPGKSDRNEMHGSGFEGWFTWAFVSILDAGFHKPTHGKRHRGPKLHTNCAGKILLHLLEQLLQEFIHAWII